MPQAIPAGTAPQAQMHTDVFCDGCGYNLHGQLVHRDENLGIFVCRCPECGRFHPAGHATDAGRPWLIRLGVFLILLRVLALLACLVLLVVGLGALQYAILDEPWHGSLYAIERTQEQWSEFARNVFFAYGLGDLAVGLAGGMFLVIFLHHWRRRIFRLATLLPLLVAIAIGVAWRLEHRRDPSLSDYMLQDLQRRVTMLENLGDGAPQIELARARQARDERLLLHRKAADRALRSPIVLLMAGALVQALAFLVGTLIGRPMARGLLRMLIPPRTLQCLTFMWVVDGKRPPGTAPTRAGVTAGA